MHIASFTERPYPYVPEDEIFRDGFFGITLFAVVVVFAWKITNH
jgi:hypothetical protein